VPRWDRKTPRVNARPYNPAAPSARKSASKTVACALLERAVVNERMTRRSLIASQQGGLLDYAALVGVAGLAIAGVIVALGIPLLRFFRFAEFIASAPIP
jgi:hypothetical protein